MVTPKIDISFHLMTKPPPAPAANHGYSTIILVAMQQENWIRLKTIVQIKYNNIEQKYLEMKT